MSNPELRSFLQALRARIRPSDVGLPERPNVAGGVRRVPGLRREEVAQLAMVSVDYYARLEQGRTRHVSEPVLKAVADALRMDETERQYFNALAVPRRKNKEAVPSCHRLRPSVHRLLSAFSDTPAFVLGRGTSVLAMNQLARALMFDLDAVPDSERNLARWVFLNPESRERYVDWESTACEMAAVLRAEGGVTSTDGTVSDLVAELTMKSADFRRMWSAHRVYECTHGTKDFRHPVVGSLQLDYEGLDLPGIPGQRIFTYSAAEGSPSEQALRLLAMGFTDA
ncbi:MULTISPECIES: helix-turn-helix transcriptional regulator [Rhodococcus]|uniref:helix-turn-helix transcriptional regulator n=1 Tax=Rhodococcus TaxID=1827 RepID=UPI002474B974|nr:helix-turn-helix transcriptional regulator [Rhodococcus opacus]MDH6292425.1 transcriptional regulator with XRE-family HTH domain [Rhodococcus opacus]